MEEPRSIISNVISELQEWCAQKYGRNSKVARMLRVSPQLVNDWFRGNAIPTWEAGIKIEIFLKKSDDARKKAIGEETTRK